MMKLYLAGSLFSEADITQRKKEGTLLSDHFPDATIVNPIDQPFNQQRQSLPTPLAIFDGDAEEIMNCDVFIADITNEDPGVMLAIGIAISHLPKIIIAINSDSRINTASQYQIPSYGMNHFVLGAIQKHGHLVSSFEEAITLLKEMTK